MLVTLFSDASICPTTGCVGWAGWAKCDRGTARGEGILKRLTVDSAVAEAMAAVNTIVIARQGGLIEAGDRVLVQTDNNSVMDILKGTARRGVRRANRDREDISQEELHNEVLHRNEEIDEIARTYAAIVSDMNLMVIWRHCKGHRGLEDRRAAVNSDCDQRARVYMNEARRRMRDDGPGNVLAMAA